MPLSPTIRKRVTERVKAVPVDPARARRIGTKLEQMGDAWRAADHRERQDLFYRASVSGILSANTTVPAFEAIVPAVLNKYPTAKSARFEDPARIADLIKIPSSRHDDFGKRVRAAATYSLDLDARTILNAEKAGLRDLIGGVVGVGHMKSTFAANKLGWRGGGTLDTVMAQDYGLPGSRFASIKPALKEGGMTPGAVKARREYDDVIEVIEASSGMPPADYQWTRYSVIKQLPDIPHTGILSMIRGDVPHLEAADLRRHIQKSMPGSGFSVDDQGRAIYTSGTGRFK